jgi:hypothetical protein
MQQPTPQPLFQVAPRVVSRVVQGKALVLDHERDEIQQLNAVGSHLWALLSARPTPLTALVEGVVSEFEVTPLDAERDVRAFLDELLARALVLVTEA